MKDQKKELIMKYKERKVIGGVYVIKNTANNKLFLDCSTNLQGTKNRFEFAKKTGSCVYMKLQKDWKEQGSDDFIFEVLEELQKVETQTNIEFKSDVEALKEMWLAKLKNEDLY